MSKATAESSVTKVHALSKNLGYDWTMLRSLREYLSNWKKSGHIPTMPLHWDREPYIPLHVLDLIHDLTYRAVNVGKRRVNFAYSVVSSIVVAPTISKESSAAYLALQLLDPDRDHPIDNVESSNAFQSQVERIVAQFGNVTKRQFEAAQMLSPTESSERVRTAAMRVVFDELAKMLERANYRRLVPCRFKWQWVQPAIGEFDSGFDSRCFEG